jgi:hypothetical protein
MSDQSLLRGSFRLLFLYDVAEGIDLTKLRQILGIHEQTEGPAFPRRTPEHIRFAHPPVIQTCGPACLKTGETAACSIKYYAFAVVAVEMDVPFACGWTELLAQSARWMDAVDAEPAARAMLEAQLQRIAPAVLHPTKQWLQEMYVVINLQEAGKDGDERPTAAELLSSHGPEIVELIRGEVTPVATQSAEEALQSSLSYYPSDLIVIGSSGALVYDRAEDVAAATQVLEFAKMQLLEFRYYDNWMSELLTDIYTMLDRKRNVILSRWTLPREAQRINAIRLDVMDLTERIDNAIKFVSDVYYARVYRLAATRTGVTEYRELVDEKLRTAGELYEFMVDQFDETRSFALEVIVGILALIDVIFLFKR